MIFYIYPWKSTSEAAKLLASKLGGRLTRDMRNVKNEDIVVNWGWGDPLGLTNRHTILNKYNSVRKAINKLVAYRTFNQASVPTLAYTESHTKASSWLTEGSTVYGRCNSGMDGEGIKVYHPGDPLDYHQFYTKGFPTKREFRVNCAFGEAIDICEKKRKTGTNPDLAVRTGENWVYCRNNLGEYPERVGKQAARAVKSLGLDFGGVDIGLSDLGSVCVFEVNTAPWLGNLIAEKYANIMLDRFS